MSEYRFVIDGSYTPDTLPMERLADYMRALSDLLGEAPSVHFRGVEAGSAVLIAAIEQQATVRVRERLVAVKQGTGAQETLKAFHRLDDYLRTDYAVGRLMSSEDSVVVFFPGRDRLEPLTYGPFKQDGTLDGELIRIGGKDETISVALRDGPIVHSKLETTREIARKLAHHLFDGTLRVRGTGTWYRTGDGSWELRHFKVVDFEVLDDAPLSETVQRLRNTPGNEWREVPDPVRELLEHRHGDGEGN